MNSTIRRLLKSAGMSLRLDRLFRYTYALLQEPALDDTPDRVIGVFTDSCGNRIELLAGLRDRVAPYWKGMVHAPKTPAPPAPRAGLAKIKTMRDRFDRVDALLRAYSLSFAGQDVLEVGAHDGATAYALAQAGARSVLATDVAAYYITQTRNGVVRDDAVAEKNAELARMRDAYRTSVDERTAQRVAFQEDDICSSSLQSDSVDAVMSLEVLEHLMRPEDAFREIARILRPGGFAFHEYNPYFALNGGHSLCTLDFPWGHARLDAADFERYLDERRPGEKSVALSFYRNNLNRMTLWQLRQYAQQSGMILLSLLPWSSERHLAILRSETLTQCSRVYPSAELIDLISPTVWVLLKKDE